MIMVYLDLKPGLMERPDGRPIVEIPI